ncbi:hypothetical protein TWF694_004669 [Orbilia ellipsospora]|uniref:Uncharacterized protein n=1 Tax=Orbilia ellipsospora TaxID=2528407 RepID=A0AAV9WYE1_9PEZI
MDTSLTDLTHDDYTVACICPMGIELAPVRAMLDIVHPALPTKRDVNSYTLGRMGVHNVVIAVMPEIGNSKAATVATQLLNDFRSIRFGLLVGIGGGVPCEGEADIRLGDVVVSKPTSTFGGVVQFDMGKIHPNGKFERTGTLKKPPAVLMANVHKLEAEHRVMGSQIMTYLSEMLNKYPMMEDEYSFPGADQDQLFEADYNHEGGKTCRKCDPDRTVERTRRKRATPRIHYGTIGSANEVIKDAQTRDKLREDLGILCVEMEAAGLMDEFSCLVIRGICDYADSHKNKMWQPYAAATAAAYAKELLSIIPAQEIVKTAKAADAFEKSKEQDRLLSLLPRDERAAFNSYDNQHDHLCLPDTRVDVLKEIEEWADSSGGRCIFWLKGMAGTGKSTIARTIARKCHNENRLGASFFFSSRSGGDLAHAGKFFTTLTWQLAKSSIAVRSAICDAIGKCSDISGQALRDQWEQLIVKPLSQLSDDTFRSPLVLVVDALDECHGENDIRVLLQLMGEARLLRTVQLRILITSRPENYIRHSFNQIPATAYQDFVLHNVSSLVIDKDISTFFRHYLNIIREERGFPPGWPGDQTIERLVQSASGLFIWAATACRFIENGGLFTEKRLSLILKGNPSVKGPEAKLNEIYSAILTNVVHEEYDEMEKEELYELLKATLGTVVTLFSSLPTVSLEKVLQIPQQDIYQTLDDLHSVLEVPKNMHQPIRLHHPSFRDFLLDKQRCDEHFWVDEKKAHGAITASCLRIMSLTLKRDICDLRSASTLTSEVDSSRVEKCLSVDLQYACRYWVQHLGRSEASIVNDSQVYEFLQDHFLHWLEALSLIEKISEAVNTIAELATYLSTLQNSIDAHLYDFVRDAKRFILKSRSVIELAPLQVYNSALVFTPTKSIVKNLFLNQAPSWIKRMPAVEDKWGALLQTLDNHTRSVYSVAFSPDGRLFATTSSDNTVRVWDPKTGAPQGTFEGHSDVVRAVAFSPNGQVLASGSSDKTIKLWDPRLGTLFYTLEGHSDWIRSVIFSPDGQILVSASSDKTIKMWDLNTNQLSRTIEGHSDWVKAVVYSPDGRLLASASSKAVWLWDPRTGMSSGILEGHSDWVRAVTFSPDGQLLASASCDKTVRLWDVKTRTLRGILEGHSEWVRSVAFSPDGQTLASASTDKTIKLWNAQTRALCNTLEGHEGWIRGISFSPDSQLLVSASSDSTIKLWDPTRRTDNTFDPRSALEPHSDGIWAVAHSSDGQYLASASFDTTVKIWDIKTGVLHKTLQGHSSSVWAVAFSPDCQLLASSSADKTVKLWDPKEGTLIKTLEGHSATVWTVSFSPDGRFFVSASEDTTLRLWNPITKEALQVLWLPVDQRPTCLSVLNNAIVIGYMSGRLTFIELDTVALLDHDESSGQTAAVSPQFQMETAQSRALKRKQQNL